MPDRPVILTLGVPEPVPGSDWGCAVQITGLTRELSRPRYVFGVDALQALELALQYAKVTLETSGYELRWLHAMADLGLPRILPMLPQPFQERLERVVDREVLRFYAAVKGSASKRSVTRRRKR